MEQYVMPKNQLVRDNIVEECEKLGYDIGYAVSKVKSKKETGEYQWRHKLNASIKFNINQALVGEVVDTDKLVDALQLIFERLYLDGETSSEILGKIDERRKYLGSYSKRLMTTEDVLLPEKIHTFNRKGHYINKYRFRDNSFDSFLK